MFSSDPPTMETVLSFTDDCLPPEQEYESRDALFKAKTLCFDQGSKGLNEGRNDGIP
jgi:hypothetical protein